MSFKVFKLEGEAVKILNIVYKIENFTKSIQFPKVFRSFEESKKVCDCIPVLREKHYTRDRIMERENNIFKTITDCNRVIGHSFLVSLLEQSI